jgi:hypothetical protein
MVATPVPTPVARPPDETVAVVALDVDQVTSAVRFLVLRLEYVPVAVNCWVCPVATEATTGDTETVNRTGGNPRA